MIDQQQIDKLKEMFELSHSPLFIFPTTTDVDLFAASYSLFSFFNMRQECRLLTPTFEEQPYETIDDYFHPNKIETEMGRENLLISFPYQEAQVDKVSYHIGEDGKRFHLTIKPRKGTAPLDSKQVEFSYAGAATDFICLLGVEQLEDLSQLYFAYENIYKNSDSQLVTIGGSQSELGQVRIETQALSYCEVVFELIKQLAPLMEIDLTEFFTISRTATLLLYGIECKSNALQNSDTSPSTFIAAGELLNLGASRLFKTSASTTKKLTPSKNTRQSKNTEVKIK
jgi:hypothetical protein